MANIDFRFSTLKNIENSVIIRIAGDWDLSNGFFYGSDLTLPFKKLASKGYSNFIIDSIIKEVIPKRGKLFIIFPGWMREWIKIFCIYKRLKKYETHDINEAIKLLKSETDR